MKKKKKPSKGMRKHIRRQKSQQKKGEAKKQTNKQATSRLPNYEDFPRRIKGSHNWTCPHCGAGQHYSHLMKKNVQTQQGPREIFECENTSCSKTYRA